MEIPKIAGPSIIADAPPEGAIAQDIDRLTFVCTVYHQHSDKSPVAIDCRYSVLLETSEQLYSRDLKVDGCWKDVESGWLNKVGFLVIENHKPKYLTNPSAEQIAEDAKRIVEVAFDGHKPWLIRPGSILPAEPSDMSGLKIRCQHGCADVTISALPK